MPTTPETRLLLNVAERYYKKHEQKKDIARQLGLDPRKIKTLLLEAEKRGLVEVTLHRPPDVALQDQVRERYPHLREVLISPEPRDQSEQTYLELLKTWAFLAAGYFDRLVESSKNKLLVGISGGETLLEFVESLPMRPRPNLEVTTTALVGRGWMPTKNSHVDPIVNATILWARSGRIPGAFNTATVPPYDLSAEPDIRSALRRELKRLGERDAIRRIIAHMEGMDVAIAGLGLAESPRDITPAFRNRLTMLGLVDFDRYPEQLVQEKAVGEIAYCFFDGQGHGHPEWELFLSPGRDKLRRSGADFFAHMVKQKKTVMVIAGQRKEPAIRAALAGKLFNVWITDAQTARAMLSEAG